MLVCNTSTADRCGTCTTVKARLCPWLFRSKSLKPSKVPLDLESNHLVHAAGGVDVARVYQPVQHLGRRLHLQHIGRGLTRTEEGSSRNRPRVVYHQVYEDYTTLRAPYNTFKAPYNTCRSSGRVSARTAPRPPTPPKNAFTAFTIHFEHLTYISSAI